jgi:hypothetical protein
MIEEANEPIETPLREDEDSEYLLSLSARLRRKKRTGSQHNSSPPFEMIGETL